MGVGVIEPEPPDVIHHLNGCAEDELGRPAQSATQDDRFGIAAPRGGARRCGLRGFGAREITEGARQRGQQCRAFGGFGPGCGYRGDGDRRDRRAPGGGDAQDRAEGGDGEHERGDDQGARWTVGLRIGGGAVGRLLGGVAGHLVSSMSGSRVLD